MIVFFFLLQPQNIFYKSDIAFLKVFKSGYINFKLEVDGHLKQQGNTSLMLFDFGYIISYLSKFFTLKSGDLIFTGTPKGVGPVSNGNKLSAYIEDEKLLEFDIK